MDWPDKNVHGDLCQQRPIFVKIKTFIYLFILGLILDFSPLFFSDDYGWWSWKLSTMLITTGYCIIIYVFFLVWQALESKIGPNSIVRFVILFYLWSKIIQVTKQAISCVHYGLGGNGELSEHVTALEVVCILLSILIALAATIRTKSGNLSIYSNISPTGDQSEIGFSFKNKKG